MSTATLSSFSGPRTSIIRPLDGQNQQYENVPGDGTVRSLKERVFVAEGISVEDQKLIYGAEIMDDSRTLESYHIRDGFVIRLLTVNRSQAATPVPQSSTGSEDDRILRTVFVRSANGPSVAMRGVKLLTTIEAFREQYCERQGSEPEHCRLIFSGKELEDRRGGAVMTLRDYDVQNESSLHEVFRVPVDRSVLFTVASRIFALSFLIQVCSKAGRSF